MADDDELNEGELTAEEILRRRERWRRAARAKLARESPEARAARLKANRERAAARRLADPEAVRRAGRVDTRAYRARHPDRQRATHASYRDRNRERMRLYWRQRKARKRGAVCVYPVAHRDYALILLADPCTYCGAPADSIDHITAIARGGSDEWDNLTAACVSCNSAKHARTLLEAVL